MTSPIPPAELSRHLAPGPVALIVNEDDVELASTVEHHRALGFGSIAVLGGGAVPDGCIALATAPGAGIGDAVNACLPALAGRWVLVIHNGEYLIYPFCETRTIRDVVQFMSEERRRSVFCVTVDLYLPHMDRMAAEFPREAAHFDRIGYYSMPRFDGPQALERQTALFGGLKWRYAEHVQWERQAIDRIALFHVDAETRLRSDGRPEAAEMNTLSCPWHHNLTAAIASWRVAKSLARNPGSSWEIEGFMWPGSAPFEWTSQQLMSAGLIEPGQWF